MRLVPVGRFAFGQKVLLRYRTPLRCIVHRFHEDFCACGCLAHLVIIEIAAISLVAAIPCSAGRPFSVVWVSFIVAVLCVGLRGHEHNESGYHSISSSAPSMSLTRRSNTFAALVRPSSCSRVSSCGLVARRYLPRADFTTPGENHV